MPPLRGAVSLPQRDHAAVGQPEYLNLDVPGTGDIALEQDRGAAEEPLGARARRLEARTQRLRVRGDGHADAATARRRLDHDRVADPLGLGDRVIGVAYWLCGAERDGHAGLGHQVAGADLVAHLLDRLGRRADPRQASVDDLPGERGVLGQEPVSGMDRLRPGLRGGREDRLVRSGSSWPPAQAR